MGESSSSSLIQCELLLKEHHPSLEVSLETIEVSANRLDWVIVVRRRVKFYSKAVGPLDDMKIVIFNNLHFTVYVFCDIFAEGDLETPQDVERLTFLVRLSDLSWIVCHGVDNYSSYNVYGIKDAVNVTIPPDTVRHKSCEKFFQCGKAHKSDMCQYCLSLKYYLTRKKNTLSSDDARLRRQSIHSTVPMDYLSPASRSKRIDNMRTEIEILRQKVRPHNQTTSMDLEDEQNEEMIRLVQYISDSDVGLSEQEKIYQEADEAGDGKGIVLKNTWENDVAMFYSDQHQNSMLNCYCNGFKLVL